MDNVLELFFPMLFKHGNGLFVLSGPVSDEDARTVADTWNTNNPHSSCTAKVVRVELPFEIVEAYTDE